MIVVENHANAIPPLARSVHFPACKYPNGPKLVFDSSSGGKIQIKQRLSEQVWTYKVVGRKIIVRHPSNLTTFKADRSTFFMVSDDEIERSRRKGNHTYQITPAGVRDFIIMRLAEIKHTILTDHLNLTFEEFCKITSSELKAATSVWVEGQRIIEKRPTSILGPMTEAEQFVAKAVFAFRREELEKRASSGKSLSPHACSRCGL